MCATGVGNYQTARCGLVSGSDNSCNGVLQKIGPATQISKALAHAIILHQYYDIGFLIAFESLLSTAGKESGMLGDTDATIRKLSNFSLRIILADETDSLTSRI